MSRDKNTARKRTYRYPSLSTAPVNVVEELLAVGYRKQAERWAESARKRMPKEALNQVAHD